MGVTRTCQPIGRKPKRTHDGRRSRCAMFFGLIGVFALLAKTNASPFVPEQLARCASNAIRKGSLKGTSLTLLRDFGVPKPVSSEYVSLTCRTPRKKSTLLQR